MGNFKKNLKLSYVLKNLIGDQLNKNGKSKLYESFKNNLFVEKLFLNEQISSSIKEGLKVKLRKFYYKWVAYFLIKNYEGSFTNVKYYNKQGTLIEPDYLFIASFISGGTKMLTYNMLTQQKSKFYKLNNDIEKKWILDLTSSSYSIEIEHYNSAMAKLITTATASGATYGGVIYKMVDAPPTASSEWVNAFPASEIFADVDDISKGLLAPMEKAIKKQ